MRNEIKIITAKYICPLCLTFLFFSCISQLKNAEDNYERQKKSADFTEFDSSDIKTPKGMRRLVAKIFFESKNNENVINYTYKGKVRVERINNKVYFNYENLIIDLDDKTELFELFNSGLLDEPVVYNNYINTSIFSLTEILYLKPIQTKRRYEFYMNRKNNEGITLVLIEIENNKANKDSSFKEFLKNARLVKYILLAY